MEILDHISLPHSEIETKAVRASGPGGQNVNKVSSAVHLRFDVKASSLPENVKEKLLALRDRRLSRDGVIVIKAQKYRDQEKNREDALERLQAMIRKSLQVQPKRIPSRPSRKARRKRTDDKTRRGRLKELRKKVQPD